jgi:hypothetical protein
VFSEVFVGANGWKPIFPMLANITPYLFVGAISLILAEEFHSDEFNKLETRVRFDQGFRADLIIERKIIIKLKSVDRVSPAHKKQLLTYWRLTDLKIGYLLNFGDALMKDGISRIIHRQL